MYLAQSKPACSQTKASVVAVVDGTAISSVDLKNKVKLLLLTTGKIDNAENMKLHQEEALEMLIDETLKIHRGFHSHDYRGIKNIPTLFEKIFFSFFRCKPYSYLKAKKDSYKVI